MKRLGAANTILPKAGVVREARNDMNRFLLMWLTWFEDGNFFVTATPSLKPPAGRNASAAQFTA